MGKLDYLSKYMDTSTDKPKKKKSKKSKRKDEVRLNDEDDVLVVPVKQNEGEDDDDDDEDRPTVVPASDVGAIIPDEGCRSTQEWRLVEDMSTEGKRRNTFHEDKHVVAKRNDDQSRKKRYDSDGTTSDASANEKATERRKRYDSDDESLSRRQDSDLDVVPVRQSKRYDSDDSQDAPHRKRDDDNDDRKLSRRVKRHDSDDEKPRRYDSDSQDPPHSKRNNHDNDRNLSRRVKRHDSDDEKTRRHDSDNEDPPHVKRYNDDNGGKLSRRIKRHDSDDEERRRYDSDANDRLRRKGHDYEYGTASKRTKRHNAARGPDEIELSRKTRYDSDDDVPSRKVKRRDSDDRERNEQTQYDSASERRSKGRKDHKSGDSEDRRGRMSSGHLAGLQKVDDFRDTERQIQEKRRKDAQSMVDRHGMGETVYRNEMGQKVDSPPTKKLRQLNQKEQVDLNKGRVQKEQEASFQNQFRELQGTSFARHADDSGLESLRKDAIRKGDPMAKFAGKKTTRTASEKPDRPYYKGPAPKPNRFGIRPGYRWDGVDRGNGFEDKALASKFSANLKKEQAYRWSTSDM